MCIRDSVQKPHPGVQAELGANQFALVLLGLIQAVVRAGLLRPVGAGVDHARTQDQPVELITDVVMVGNRLGVPSGAVESAAAPTYFLCGPAGRWSHRTDPSSAHRGCEALPRTQTNPLMMRDPFDHVRQIEHGEDITLQVHVPRHIGTNQTELARSPQQSTQAPTCLLYTSDAADDLTRVDLGG